MQLYSNTTLFHLQPFFSQFFKKFFKTQKNGIFLNVFLRNYLKYAWIFFPINFKKMWLHGQKKHVKID